MIAALASIGCPPPRAPTAELDRFNPPRIQILSAPRLRTPPGSLILAAPLGPEVTVVPRVGHDGVIVDVDVRADGEIAVTASRDATVKIWDLRSGALLRTLSSGGEATAVHVLPDGKRVLVAGRDGRLRIWALSTGQLLRTIVSDADAAITAMAVAPDGARVAIARGSTNGDLAMVDLATGKTVSEVAITSRVEALSFTKSGRGLVSGDASGSLKRYDANKLALQRTIAGHAREISALATSADGRRVLSASADGRLKLWDVTSGALLSVVAAHSKPIRAVAVSENAERAVSASDDGTVKLWDVGGTQALATLTGHVGPVTALAAFDGERRVITGGADGTLRSWDLAVGEELASFPANDDAVAHTSVSRSGRTALTVSASGVARMWDLSSLSVARQWHAGEGITAAALSPDATHALTATADARGAAVLSLWEIGAGRVVHSFDSRNGAIISAAFSPRGLRAVTGSILGGVELWGTAIRRPLRRLVGHTSPVRALSVAEDGRRALTSATAPMVGPDRVKLWDLDTGTALSSFEGFARGALSGDGRRAALASRSGEVAVLDLDTGEVERSWPGHPAPVRAVATDRRMRVVVTGDAEGTIAVWDNVRRRLSRKLNGHRGAIRTLHLSGDATRLVSSGDDGTLRVWRLDTGTSVTLVAREDQWLVFSSDGYFAASARGAELAFAVTGARGFRLDQLGALHNRPDMLLERIGVGSEELIADFTARHQRRLREIGVTELELAKSYGDAPRVAITELEQVGRELAVTFQVAAQSAAASYQIFVNGVAWLAQPKEVKGDEISEKVVLSTGRNRVSVEVADVAGAHAIPASHVVRLDLPPSQKKRRGVLHYIGVGLSAHDHEALDTRYGRRDAVRLGDVFAGASGPFRDVRIHTVVDEEATKKRIEGLRRKLARASVDDTVVLFVAGQWAHTRSVPADPVFVPHDGDPSRLAETAIPLEEVLGLVEGIRPRRRLVIIDGCVSGDRDGRALGAALREAMRRGLRPRTSVALHLPRDVAPRTFLFQTDRVIMRPNGGGLGSGGGAVILRASRGAELCYELDESRSGALTAAVVRALTSPDADLDGDGWVSLDELESFVVPFVSNVTGGLQQPVIVRGDVEQTIRLPRVAPVEASQREIPHPLRTPPHRGCGCRVGAAGDPWPWVGWLWLLSLGAWTWRRRR
jgi:MYXO-CTERM domain-containing protein